MGIAVSEEARALRLGDLRGKELIDRAAAEHLGVVYHVDAALDETTGRLLDLHLVVRKGWFGGRQVIPWETVENVGKELIIINLELSDAAARGNVEQVRPATNVSPLARPWPRAQWRRRHSVR